MKKVIIALSLLMGFIACGPSKAELEAKEKAKMDSVAAATTKAIADEQAAQAATEAEAQNQESLKQQLIELKSQLAAEQTKLDDAQIPKLFRTEDEKAQEIADQTRAVETLKSQIRDTEKQIK